MQHEEREAHLRHLERSYNEMKYKLEAENAALRAELERERMRLAACGAAALGYFEDCLDEYKSASLDDVLRLQVELAALKSGDVVMVPREPTPEMLEAALLANMQHVIDCINDPNKAKEIGSEETCRQTYRSRYKAMLAAAPGVQAGEKGNAEVNGGRLADRPSEAV